MATEHGGMQSTSSRDFPSSQRSSRRVLINTNHIKEEECSSSSSPEQHFPVTSTPTRRKPVHNSSTSSGNEQEEDIFFRPLPPHKQQPTRLLPILSPSYVPPPIGHQRSFNLTSPLPPPTLSPQSSCLPLASSSSRHISYNIPPSPFSYNYSHFPSAPQFTSVTNNSTNTNQQQLRHNIPHYNSYKSGVPTITRLPSLSSPLSPQSGVPPSPASSPLPQLLTRYVRGRPFSERGEGEESQLDAVLPLHSLKIFIGTWNMHEEKELPNNIDDFLLPLTQETAADLYAIGTQESTPNKSDWECLLQQTLGPQYVLIHSNTLGCIYLCLLLRRDLIWYCTDVQSTSFATRPFTAIKTKGSVAIRLTLFGSPFLFITSHFTAGTSNVAERNMDMHKTINNLTFSGPIERFLESHFVFWFGDFNYRVELERDFVDKSIQEGQLMSLLLNDQLTREILAGNVFEGFSEQPIQFPPSYKFDVNSYSYDTSELVRVPSWTDRILFFAEHGRNVGGCGYDICPSILISDHRPVYGIFMVTLENTEHTDGIPTSYNREVYIKGTKKHRHKKQNNKKQSVVPQNNNKAPRPSTSNKTNTSSSVCTIL